MRTIEDHKVNLANDVLTITVLDEPGSGGGNHAYMVSGSGIGDAIAPLTIQFQDGPISEVGVNGITNEVLLAIVADRLRGFQSGPFASRHNALALTAIEEAQNWLNRRTLERMRGGVEGTPQS